MGPAMTALTALERDHERGRLVAIDDPLALVQSCLPHLMAATSSPTRASWHEQQVRHICRDTLSEFAGAEAEVAADILIALERLLAPLADRGDH